MHIWNTTSHTWINDCPILFLPLSCHRSYNPHQLTDHGQGKHQRSNYKLKLPRISINLYKVVIGVCFSLLWARLMYSIWEQPSFLTFVWFYLIIGSIILKWVIFEIVDRIQRKKMIRDMRKEVDESHKRVDEIRKLRKKDKKNR